MSFQLLGDRRILVTRGASQASKLSDGLRALGAVPVEVPVIEIVPPATYEPIDAALRNLSQYDWLIVTSANAVHVLGERAAALGLTFEEIDARPAVAAIGAATEKAACDAGLRIALTPKEYVAESLVTALEDRTVEGAQILIARAAVARDVLPDALRRAGATVNVVEAYHNRLPEAAPQQLRHAYARGLDAVTFTSSSSVTHLAEAARAGGLGFPFAHIPAISIGPATSATLRAIGWAPAAEAEPHDIQGLLEAVTRHFAPPQKA